MAINKLTSPQATPTSLTDWQAVKSLIEALYLGTELPLRIDYDNNLVLKGSVFQIGGSVYLADADTAISGTPSDYVQVAPSGSTASAAYVANLTGVTWNDTYKGYYDGSGNLYIFNEFDNQISTIRTSFGEIVVNNVLKGSISIDLTEWDTTSAPQIAAGGSCEIGGKLYKNDSAITITGSVSNGTWYAILLTPSGVTYTASYVLENTGSYDSSKQGVYSGSGRIVGSVYIDGSGNYINKNLLTKGKLQKRIAKIGSWDMDSLTQVNVVLATGTWLVDDNIILNDMVIIMQDGISGNTNNLLRYGGSTVSAVTGDTKSYLSRDAGGFFDSTIFSDSGINRGFIQIDYLLI